MLPPPPTFSPLEGLCRNVILRRTMRPLVLNVVKELRFFACGSE